MIQLDSLSRATLLQFEEKRKTEIVNNLDVIDKVQSKSQDLVKARRGRFEKAR